MNRIETESSKGFFNELEIESAFIVVNDDKEDK